MGKPRVYLETSVVSYLTARLSRDLVTVGRQELTREWWENHRASFELFISEFVVAEAAAGDPAAARLRMERWTPSTSPPRSLGAPTIS